ncbi:MAG: class I SAM-dependent rRNA methyltransferase [Ruminococcaceae bacterium]|nr:class I SAM-dependent rRNA methyltransferase [Oscillospiraceae bacterium]
MARIYPKAIISEKAEKSIRGGHIWVYDEEVDLKSPCEDGELCDVYTKKDRYLGTGFYNSNSKIRIRIISKNANDRFDEAFWERRIRYSIDYRRTVMSDDIDNCRMIFGDADGFPGLIVDRFRDVLVAEVMSLGIDKRKNVIFPLIVKILREYGEEITAVYERNDVKVRELEGLEMYKGFYKAEGLRTDLDGSVIIEENGIKYYVDYVNGQKTGFFLDQKYNRLAAARIAKDKKVLDCFTHTGAFALNTAKYASHVTALDISADALATARKNAELNGLEDKIDFVCTDVFEYLSSLAEDGKCDYDLIILDPPAFTKSSQTIKNAMRGYKEINLKAMKLLKRGSYLCTCSCSHFMRDSLFCQMLHNAASDAGISLRQIEARTQGPDHPILWNVPETDYLKFYVFQIV